jgi:hypothetical protein
MIGFVTIQSQNADLLAAKKCCLECEEVGLVSISHIRYSACGGVEVICVDYREHEMMCQSRNTNAVARNAD